MTGQDDESDDILPELPDFLTDALLDALLRAPADKQQVLERLAQQNPDHAKTLFAYAARSEDCQTEPVVGGSLPATALRIGPYRLISLLGSGGMGTVYLAAQDGELRRTVALKVIKLGMDTKSVLARFETERQALAMMSHSAIAKVLDAGATPGGRPYFVMEYVKGMPITRYCDDNKLSIEERLDLFRQVCSGVQHAHTKGVIHRDLSDNNVLVTVQDGKPHAKIIDFGLARATDHRLAQKSVFTERGVILGTPAYMSPEQARVTALDIDMRTDVYTLGVLLYALLTGKLPFEPSELAKIGHEAMCRTIRENDPPKPSTKVTSHVGDIAAAAKLRRTDARTLLHRLRGDLDWIVLKCLEKDRTRRYETVSELSADVQRHLDHEPVLARSPSAAYLLAKLVRRYRGRLVAAAVVSVAVVVGFVSTTYFWLAERRKQKELTAALIGFEQLAWAHRFPAILSAEKALYPPWPAQVEAIRRWQSEVDELLRMRTRVRSAVDDAALGRLQASPESRDFLQLTLTKLLDDLEEFEAKQVKWVERRLYWAERIEELSITRHSKRWANARRQILRANGTSASELYADPPIELPPQLGLVPIGMNPVTKLWEFYDLRTAWDGESDPVAIEIPQHVRDGDRAGDIEISDSAGIVFVLVPGGTFAMGAQRDDSRASCYDRMALEQEMPVHNVPLAPFFMARHELTQRQWQRLTQQNPSYHRSESTDGGRAGVTWANPVEQINWYEANLWLERYGMALPTEAQWEYACRAGTTTPWYCNDVSRLAALAAHANVADRSVPAHEHWADIAEDWDDGYELHAPVGRFRPNDFGLHDMHGNVWEWTRDGAYTYESVHPRPEDGLRGDPDDAPTRVYRGGCFTDPARNVRSSNRGHFNGELRNMNTGARAARAVEK